MLDSDIGNTILPHVRFYQREMKHEFNSEKENRPIYYMADFVRIEIPGNQYSIIDTIAGEHHKQIYPEAWARYQNEKKELGDEQVSGTLLKEWSLLNPAQVRELKHFHFYTVEQVAMASDAQLAPVVMIVGMGAHSFRDKARAYIAAAKGAATVDAQQQELKKRDEEIEALKAQMAQMMAMMKPEEAKRGRKPKEELTE